MAIEHLPNWMILRTPPRAQTLNLKTNSLGKITIFWLNLRCILYNRLQGTNISSYPCKRNKYIYIYTVYIEKSSCKPSLFFILFKNHSHQPTQSFQLALFLGRDSENPKKTSFMAGQPNPPPIVTRPEIRV